MAKPKLTYENLGSGVQPVDAPPPARITLLVDSPVERKDSLVLSVGDKIKTGQVVSPFGEDGPCAVASMGGTVASIDSWPGNFGKKYTAVTIEVDPDAEKDAILGDSGGKINIENLGMVSRFLPGGLPPALFENHDKIKTIVISGADEDLCCVTRQYVAGKDSDSISKGISVLRDMLGVGSLRVAMAVPENLIQSVRTGEFEVISVGALYPSANPRMLAAKVLGSPVPADMSCEEAGVSVVSAEAVAALGKISSGSFPQRKLVSVLTKSGNLTLLSVVLGTPVGDVLSACSETVEANDRIVLGGPMTGVAVYTESHPVCHDTDMVIVQGKDAIPPVYDNACINCGECVRICPANVQVNILIRYLQAGQYGDAADNHDLFSCIDCGLCSFVCPAGIPVFQYITLGKYEFARLNAAEAENG